MGKAQRWRVTVERGLTQAQLAALARLDQFQLRISHNNVSASIPYGA